MGFVECNAVAAALPDGQLLFADVSFRVGEGAVAALVGANGTGKTTLLRIIAGDLAPAAGSVRHSGGLRVMRQFIGSIQDSTTVRELLVEHAAEPIRRAARELDRAEWALAERDDERRQLRYAEALAAYGDAGGYAAETVWDTVTTAALGLSWPQAEHRMVRTLSGGEQKRLVLEALLRGPHEVLLLDEPDNYLDVPGKRWLEEQLRRTRQTVVLVSHDRQLLAEAASTIVTVEGRSAWVHGGGFGSYHQARRDRLERLDELHRRWEEERARLSALVRALRQQAANSDAMASRYHAVRTRLEKFEAAGPPAERPREQNVRMRLAGGRTAVRAVICRELELTGLTAPFDLEVWYGDRVAVLGPNGTGKSHFLRLLAGDPVPHSGVWRLGARVRPGRFAQTHDHPEWIGRTLTDILWHGDAHRPGADRSAAMGALRRYELSAQAEQRFETLSGGQQARFQILLLELSGATLLLLDEPTDNLDLHSAEVLEAALGEFRGTVLAVTHDRWFARWFDRYVVFGAEGSLTETGEPVWADAR